jgi:hypothetical protein
VLADNKDRAKKIASSVSGNNSNPSGSLLLSSSPSAVPRGLLRPESPFKTNSSSTASLADALRQSDLTKEDAEILSRASCDELSDFFPTNTCDDDDDGARWNANRVVIDPFHIPKILRKNDSYQALQRRGWNANEARVLVLYTGGTIGMVKNDDGGELVFSVND